MKTLLGCIAAILFATAAHAGIADNPPPLYDNPNAHYFARIGGGYFKPKDLQTDVEGGYRAVTTFTGTWDAYTQAGALLSENAGIVLEGAYTSISGGDVFVPSEGGRKDTGLNVEGHWVRVVPQLEVYPFGQGTVTPRVFAGVGVGFVDMALTHPEAPIDIARASHTGMVWTAGVGATVHTINHVGIDTSVAYVRQGLDDDRVDDLGHLEGVMFRGAVVLH